MVRRMNSGGLWGPFNHEKFLEQRVRRRMERVEVARTTPLWRQLLATLFQLLVIFAAISGLVWLLSR